MSSTAPGSTLASKYELIEIAGQGGMATVWKARMHGAGGISRLVAVKLMHSRLSGDRHFVDLFIEEARVCSQLQHPNVVQILDFGEQDGTYYLAIEWVDGLDLLDYGRAFSKHGFFVPWMALVTIAVEVLKGMGAAHDHLDEHGRRSPIIHRDVTPHNILLGINGVVKLTDFGLAKATDRGSMTLPHVLKGKLSYTAPEMTHGVKANERTDLFSLGVTLWEALSGRKMFDAPSPLQIVRQIQAWKIPPLDSLRRDLPPELVRVVDKATARDPADRYGSTQEMALALSQLLPPLSDLQRLGRSVVEARQRKNTELTEEQFIELSTELSSPLTAAPKFSLASSPGSAARAARVQPRPAAGQPAGASSPPPLAPPQPPLGAPSQPPRSFPSEPLAQPRHQSNTAQRHTGLQPRGNTPKTPGAVPSEPLPGATPIPPATSPPGAASRSTTQPQPAVSPQGPSVRSTTQPLGSSPSPRTTTQPPAVSPQGGPSRSTTQPQPLSPASAQPTQPPSRSTTQPQPATAARSTTQPQPAGAPARSTTQPQPAGAPARSTTQPQPAASPQGPSARSITQPLGGAPTAAARPSGLPGSGSTLPPGTRPITQTGYSAVSQTSPPRPGATSQPPAHEAHAVRNTPTATPAPSPAREDTSQDDFSVLFGIDEASSSRPPGSLSAKPTPASSAPTASRPPESRPPTTPAPSPAAFLPPRVEQMSIHSLIETSLADFSIEVTVGSSLMELPPSLLSSPTPSAPTSAARAAPPSAPPSARSAPPWAPSAARSAPPSAASATPPPRGVAPTVTDMDAFAAPSDRIDPVRNVAPTVPDLEVPPVPAPPPPQDSIQEISTLFDLQDMAPPIVPARPPPRPPPPRPPPAPPRRRE